MLINIYSPLLKQDPERPVFPQEDQAETQARPGACFRQFCQAELLADKEYVDRIIRDNADHASYLAMKTLRKVQKKLGFPERPR